MVKRPPRTHIGRKREIRDSYDRVLIVAEGAKTEPHYLEDLVNYYRLNTANIEVVGTGADPQTVVRRALAIRDKEQGQGERYDQVYCVFDRDQHARFSAASIQATDHGLRLARSWPCFEYWLLLHYEFSRQPFVNSGGRSPCGNCIRVLSQHVTGYDKATRGIFRRLVGRLERAKERARRAIRDATDTGDCNPSTEVHELVDYLQRLKKTK